MDPVTALGVAAAALQFLSFGIDALGLCCEIRDSVDRATAANAELEESCRDIKNILKDLNAANSAADKAGRRISRVAANCLATSDELLKLLQEVRGAGRSWRSSVAKALFKSLKESKKIEKLRNSLKEKEAVLNTAIIHDIRNHVDLLAIEQSKQYKTLNYGIKSLMKDLRSQQLAASASAKNTEIGLAKVMSQNRQIQQSVTTGTGHILKDVSKLRNDFSAMRNLQERSLHLEQKEKLMTAFFYPELMSRVENMTRPYFRTFGWVFDQRTFEKGPYSPQPKPWSSFPQWLRGNEPTYWICGKAGSGKSTLMAHLIDSPSTRSGLRLWAEGKALHILSFFFWRPGSELQRGVQGLLRSLLYQLVDKVANLAEEILKHFSLSLERIPAWTERTLAQMLQFALQTDSSRVRRFCFFIDGLDEYDGDTEELFALINALQNNPNIKWCVSSRPETHLVVRLSSCACLRLEELNFRDITIFVREKLQDSDLSSSEAEQIAREISKRAEGVFLWAVLISRSIVQGSIAGDDFDTLKARLDSLPSGMDALFARMLADVDEVHKQSLVFFMKALKLYRDFTSASPSVAHVTASKSSVIVQDYAALIESCQRTEKQVVAQSKDILEIRDQISFVPNWPQFVWGIPQERSYLRQAIPLRNGDDFSKACEMKTFLECDDLINGSTGLTSGRLLGSIARHMTIFSPTRANKLYSGWEKWQTRRWRQLLHMAR